MIRTHDAYVISNLCASCGGLPTGAWPRPPTQAVALPIAPSGQTGKAGILVVGLNPFRLFDDNYRGFLRLVAGQIAASIANAGLRRERGGPKHWRRSIVPRPCFLKRQPRVPPPLTLILGPIEDMLAATDGQLSEVYKERWVQSIAPACLLKLVNTLLDFSRIEAGRLQAVFEPTYLAALTADLASVFRSACKRAGVEFVIDCPPLSAPAYVDRDMWEKIVLNLLSNAFKYTLQGRIEVQLRGQRPCSTCRPRWEQGSPPPPCRISLNASIASRAKGPDIGRQRHRAGAGAGLVKLHGGSVAVEALWAGQHLRVWPFLWGCPIFRGPNRWRSLLTSTATGRTPTSEALRWLPDQPCTRRRRHSGGQRRGHAGSGTIRRDGQWTATGTSYWLMTMPTCGYVRRLLEPTGRSRRCQTGTAPRRHSARNRTLLTDVMMPRLDGFGLLRDCVACPRPVPVIMLSARAGEEARVEGLDAGADDYLVKPFSARELLARVGSTLELVRVRREAAHRERLLREKAQAALQAAEAANHAKDRFLAVLSHELRTPLTPVLMAVQDMEADEHVPEHVHRELSMIHSNIELEARLIDDLLDLTRIVRGQLALHYESIDLHSMLMHA